MAPKPIRRVVTTHHGAKSAVMIDDNLEPLQSAGGGDRVLWQSHEAPAVLTKDGDIADNSQGFYAKGSLIRVVDIAPHSKGFNHRTASLDYGIIMEGELEMLLDDGSKTRVKAGDVVVQRAVNETSDSTSDGTFTHAFRPCTNGTTPLTSPPGFILCCCQLFHQSLMGWSSETTACPSFIQKARRSLEGEGLFGPCPVNEQFWHVQKFHCVAAI